MNDSTHDSQAGGTSVLSRGREDRKMDAEPEVHAAIKTPVSACLKIVHPMNNSNVASGVSFDVKFVAPIPASGTPDEAYEILVSVPTMQGDGATPPAYAFPNGEIVESSGDIVPSPCNTSTHKIYKQTVRITVKTSRFGQIKLYTSDGTDLTFQDSISIGIVV